MIEPPALDFDVILDEHAADVRRGRHAAAITADLLNGLTDDHERGQLLSLLTYRELLRRAGGVGHHR